MDAKGLIVWLQLNKGARMTRYSLAGFDIQVRGERRCKGHAGLGRHPGDDGQQGSGNFDQIRSQFRTRQYATYHFVNPAQTSAWSNPKCCSRLT